MEGFTRMQTFASTTPWPLRTIMIQIFFLWKKNLAPGIMEKGYWIHGSYWNDARQYGYGESYFFNFSFLGHVIGFITHSFGDLHINHNVFVNVATDTRETDFLLGTNFVLNTFILWSEKFYSNHYFCKTVIHKFCFNNMICFAFHGFVFLNLYRSIGGYFIV